MVLFIWCLFESIKVWSLISLLSLFSVRKSEHEEEEHLSVPDICPRLRTAWEISLQAGRRCGDGTFPQVIISIPLVLINIRVDKRQDRTAEPSDLDQSKHSILRYIGQWECIIVCRVTRALFALAERTKMDPDFTGESLSYTELTGQSLKRKVSGSQDTVQTGSLNAIFENLMQVEAVTVRCPAVISLYLNNFSGCWTKDFHSFQGASEEYLLFL